LGGRKRKTLIAIILFLKNSLKFHQNHKKYFFLIFLINVLPSRSLYQ